MLQNVTWCLTEYEWQRAFKKIIFEWISWVFEHPRLSDGWLPCNDKRFLFIQRYADIHCSGAKPCDEVFWQILVEKVWILGIHRFPECFARVFTSKMTATMIVGRINFHFMGKLPDLSWINCVNDSWQADQWTIRNRVNKQNPREKSMCQKPGVESHSLHNNGSHYTR